MYVMGRKSKKRKKLGQPFKPEEETPEVALWDQLGYNMFVIKLIWLPAVPNLVYDVMGAIILQLYLNTVLDFGSLNYILLGSVETEHWYLQGHRALQLVQVDPAIMP